MSYKVVGIGEVLWDLLPSGPQLGGAPANFAYHAKNLGAEAKVITRVGNDAFGQEILRQFGSWGMDTSTVQLDQHRPTGSASVSLAEDGTPRFTIAGNVAWDQLTVTGEARDAVREANAVCFGSLAQRSQDSALAIRRLLESASFAALRIFDINLRQNFYDPATIGQSLALADVLKLNDHELGVLANLFALSGPVRQQIEQLAGKFDLRVVALTRGGNGSLLYQTGAWSERAAEPVKVVDTVGAGDSFTAALAMGLLGHLPLERIHQIAVELAAYVCAHPGATPVIPEHFRRDFIAAATLLAGNGQ